MERARRDVFGREEVVAVERSVAFPAGVDSMMADVVAARFFESTQSGLVA